MPDETRRLQGKVEIVLNIKVELYKSNFKKFYHQTVFSTLIGNQLIFKSLGSSVDKFSGRKLCQNKEQFV